MFPSYTHRRVRDAPMPVVLLRWNTKTDTFTTPPHQVQAGKRARTVWKPEEKHGTPLQ